MHQRWYRLVKKWMESWSACRNSVIRSFEYHNHSIRCSVVICEERTFFKAVSREKWVKMMSERDIALSRHVPWITFWFCHYLTSDKVTNYIDQKIIKPLAAVCFYSKAVLLQTYFRFFYNVVLLDPSSAKNLKQTQILCMSRVLDYMLTIKYILICFSCQAKDCVIMCRWKHMMWLQITLKLSSKF